MASGPVHSVTPILNVSSVPQSLAWFEALGWERTFSWNDGGMIDDAADEDEAGPADFAGLCSGEAGIFLCRDGQGPRPASPGEDGVWMSWWVGSRAALDDLHATAVAAGLDVPMAPTDEPWGAREFHLRHPDGHRFRVSAQ